MKKRTFFDSFLLFYSEELWGPSHIWRKVGYEDFEKSQLIFKSYQPECYVLIGTMFSHSFDCWSNHFFSKSTPEKGYDTHILSLSRLEESDHILRRTKEIIQTYCIKVSYFQK